MADINSIVLPDGTEYPISDYYLPVAISNPASGQVLKYDAENQVWYNGEDASGSSVLYGTSAPTSQLGTDGCLYVKYTEGTGGASDTVDDLYVKLDGAWCQISTGGGGGTSDYNDLTNKPQINSVELSGNKSLDDLGIQPSEISKTATGSIVTFSDGGDNIPVESFECEIVAQQESGTPNPDNPLLITGFDSADIVDCGKNLFDESQITNASGWSESGGVYTGSIAQLYVYANNGFPKQPKYKVNTQYVLSVYINATNGVSRFRIYYTDSTYSDLAFDSTVVGTTLTHLTSINKTIDKITFTYNSGGDLSISKIQLEESTAATSYTPYTGTLYSIAFGQTIYGGKLVYANGKWFIRATHVYIALNGTENLTEFETNRWRYNTGIALVSSYSIQDKEKCSHFAVANTSSWSGLPQDCFMVAGGSYIGVGYTGDFNAYALAQYNNGTPIQFAILLTTPLLIPLTSSVKIKTLPGVNNIFSNTGDSTLKYFTNDADGIEELINTSETSAENTKIDDTNLAYEADNVQEAFEKITKSITWAEYQALSEEEKNNGTAYFITDVNGDGQNFQPVIYSEEEREIGVWTDGKPLYEKSITANVTHNPFSIDVSDLHIDNIVVNDGFIVQTIDNVVYIPYSSSNYDYAFSYYNNNCIKCSYAGAYNATTWHIRIRYTKTTDTAGSGTWTPQGVPAHHYSTSEQVIGTWIDGKPLYEKTIKFNNKNVTMNENTSELVHGISDIDTAFVHEAYADFGGGENWSTAMNGILAGSTMCYFQWKIGSTAIYLVANNLSFSASTDRSYLFVIRYTKSS